MGQQQSVLFGHGFFPSATATFLFVDVCVVEEPGEQHQVTKVHGRRQRHVELGHAARLGAATLEVPVSCVVDEAAYKHLHQLTGRNEHGHPGRRPVAHGPGRVVRVHHRMDGIVHDDEPPGGRREFHVREPRVQQHGNVVIPVQKDERLFSQHDEYGVSQLGQL